MSDKTYLMRIPLEPLIPPRVSRLGNYTSKVENLIAECHNCHYLCYFSVFFYDDGDKPPKTRTVLHHMCPEEFPDEGLECGNY